MIKKTVAAALLSSSIALTAFSASAASDNSFYVTGKLGASLENMSKIKNSADNQSFGSKHKNVFAGGIGVGYDFSSKYDVPVRLELDNTDRASAKIFGMDKTLKVGIDTLMLNGFYDFHMDNSPITPYITAGLGYADVRTRLEQSALGDSSKSNYNFAWNVGVGAKYNLTDNFALDLSYRYVDAGKAKVNGPDAQVSTKARANDIMLGAIYSF